MLKKQPIPPSYSSSTPALPLTPLLHSFQEKHKKSLTRFRARLHVWTLLDLNQ
jgi:hypothetical protein